MKFFVIIIFQNGMNVNAFPKDTTGAETNVICTGNIFQNLTQNKAPTSPTDKQVYANNLYI